METCRFCRDATPDFRPMVRYSVRHNAHWDCFVERKGFAGLERLTDWQLSKLPFRLMEKLSPDEQRQIRARVEADQKRTAEYLARHRRIG